jgi:hypothetical protein
MPGVDAMTRASTPIFSSKRPLNTCGCLSPFFPVLDTLHAKIDGLAEWLTGEQGYFSRGYMSNTAQPETLEKWRRWDAIERGDEPRPEA